MAWIKTPKHSTQNIFLTCLAGLILSTGCTTKPKNDTSQLNILERGYIGIRMNDNFVKLKEPIDGCTKALQPHYVIVDGPAWKAGLRVGDLIYKIDGVCAGDDPLILPSRFPFYIQSIKPGTVIQLQAIQNLISGALRLDGEKVEDLAAHSQIAGANKLLENEKYQKVTAEWTIARNTKSFEILVQNWLGYTDQSETASQSKLEQELERFDFYNSQTDLQSVIAKHKLAEEWNKVQTPLSATASRANSLQPALVNSMFLKPLQLEKNQNWILQKLQGIRQEQSIQDSSELLLKVSSFKNVKQSPKKSNDSVLYHLVSEISEIKKLQKSAFENLTSTELQHLKEVAPSLFGRHAIEQYVSTQKTLQETAVITQTFDELDRVKIEPMLQAHLRLSQLLNQENLKKILIAAKAELSTRQKTIYVSPQGKLLLADASSHRHMRIDKDVVLIVDVGGNDTYYNVSTPILDFAGDDQYETSAIWSTGAGFFDVNALVDVSGNDRYIGREGVFGAAFFGVSLFADLEGQDEYRCSFFCEGVAIAGVSTFIDGQGNDRFEATLLSQGVTVAGGYNLFLDLAGDDSYFSKGLEATSYDDPGQFAGWSQGVAIGLRPMAAGGVSLLYDRSGKDRFEAGTFSQGGGYYYGFGQFVNDGLEDDVYIGSRYSQGFSAHQAIGGFIEIGGADLYSSNSDVGEGMSWDLSLTYFEDKAGNDTYQTCAHCLGTAAQTSLTIFIDKSGHDTYKGVHLPYAPDVENEYHKFNSFGFFFDLNGDDRYEKFKNNSEILRPKYQILTDSN